MTDEKKTTPVTSAFEEMDYDQLLAEVKELHAKRDGVEIQKPRTTKAKKAKKASTSTSVDDDILT